VATASPAWVNRDGLVRLLAGHLTRKQAWLDRCTLGCSRRLDVCLHAVNTLPFLLGARVSICSGLPGKKEAECAGRRSARERRRAHHQAFGRSVPEPTNPLPPPVVDASGAPPEVDLPCRAEPEDRAGLSFLDGPIVAGQWPRNAVTHAFGIGDRQFTETDDAPPGVAGRLLGTHNGSCSH
jgi:hypothetical protein